MASTLKVTVGLELDGLPVAGFPWVRRLVVDEVQTFAYEQATGGGYVATPTDRLDTLQVLALRPTQPMTLRLQAQSDAGCLIGADGLVLLVNVALSSGAATNAKLDNASGVTSVIDGLAAGT